MKKANKVLLINFAIAVVVTVLISLSFKLWRAEEIALAFGVVCLGLGLLNLLIGVILLIVDRKTVREGWLLSGAILLLLSGITCGSAAGF